MGRGMRVYTDSNQRVLNVTVRNCKIHNSRASNLIFTGSRKINSLLPLENMTVENCDLYWAGSYYPKRHSTTIGWPGNLTFRAVQNSVVRGCKIHENWGESILVARIADSVSDGVESSSF